MFMQWRELVIAARLVERYVFSTFPPNKSSAICLFWPGLCWRNFVFDGEGRWSCPRGNAVFGRKRLYKWLLSFLHRTSSIGVWILFCRLSNRAYFARRETIHCGCWDSRNQTYAYRKRVQQRVAEISSFIRASIARSWCRKVSIPSISNCTLDLNTFQLTFVLPVWRWL
jgi:hypothetical protein